MEVIGRWSDFIRVHPKVGVIAITTESKGKFKIYALKMFNTQREPNKLDDIAKSFHTYKNMEVKASYGLSEMNEYNGRLQCSEAICWNIEPAGADPEPAKELPDKQSESVIDESDELPF